MNTIKLYGKDYSPLKDVVCKIDNKEIHHIKLDDGSILKLDDEKSRELLVKTLLDSSSDLIKNSTAKSNNNKPLYEDFKGLRFGGYAGIISGKITINLSDYSVDTSECLADPQESHELNITLQIQSRFDALTEHPYFLATMLMTEGNIKLSGQDVPSNDEELFDFLLIIRFKNCLKNAYYKGFYRAYHTFENNDDRIKGSVDVARHIKENMGLSNGRVAYRYREKTVDNYLNHLIVAAYFYFKKLHPELTNSYFDSDKDAKSILDFLIASINYPKYDIRTLILKNLTSISHPYYTEYEALRIVSLRVLRNEGISIFDGNLDETEGILFYLPDLFEDFLEGLFMEKHFIFEAQDSVSIFSYEADTAKFHQATHPDFVFYTTLPDADINKKVNLKSPYMILDAKFKKDWSEKTSSDSDSLGSNRLLSDYDKCIRDMNSCNCHATGVVFPTNEDQLKDPNGHLRHGISNYNSIDTFYTIPLYVPANNTGMTYNTWSEEFEKSCESFLTQTGSILTKEESFFASVSSEIDLMKEKRNSV